MGKFWADVTAKRGYMFHMTGKEDQAMALYEKAYEKGGTDANAMAAYGLLLMRKGNDQKAIEVLKSATKQKLKPNQWLTIYQNLGLAYWLSGNLDRALRLFERICERNASTNARGTYGCLLIEKADETKDYEKALSFCMDSYAYDDEDPVIIDNLGQVYLKMGELQKAEEMFERALRFREDQFDTLYSLAKIRISQGKEEEAARMLTKALHKKESRFNTIPRQKAVELAASIGLLEADLNENGSGDM